MGPIPDPVWNAILSQGGVWAALFLLSVSVLMAVTSLMWRALREEGKRAPEVQKACDEEIKRERQARIDELKSVLTTVQNVTRAMEEREKSSAIQSAGMVELSQALMKAIVTSEGNQRGIQDTLGRVERDIRGLSEVVRPVPAGVRRS